MKKDIIITQESIRQIGAILIGLFGILSFILTDKSSYSAIQVSQLANECSLYLLLGIIIKP